ncbi:MAG: hypothetical protein WKF40_07760 [Thermoleophilaceae bacterium]
MILWGERAAQGERAKQARRRAPGGGRVARRWHEKPESGLIEVPADTNARGIREAGVAPALAPGLTDASETGMGAAAVPAALGDGGLSTLVLLNCDPLSTHPRPGRLGVRPEERPTPSSPSRSS